MAQIVVAVGTAAAIGLTAAPVEAHPEWDTFRHRRMSEFDAPRMRTLVNDGLTALLIEQVTERERALKRARRDWERLDAAWDRAQEPVPEPEPSSSTPVVTGDVASIICDVFGPYCSEAISVATCESGLDPAAVNGQYLGTFQMGETERATYGHGSDAFTQAVAAERYFLATGATWGPWACKP